MVAANMTDKSTPSQMPHVVIAAILAGLGLVLFLTTGGKHAPEDFWTPYVQGCNRIGALLLIFGVTWTVLSLFHTHSHFFELDRHMDSGQFTVSLVVIIILMSILLMAIMPHLPQTAPSQLSMDPKIRATTLRMEANFHRLVALGIIASGAALASIPFRRFLRP